MYIKITSPKFGEHIVAIDDADYDLVSKYKWHINYHNRNVYVTSVNKVAKKIVSIKLHRLILGFPKQHIDHIDGNGLNNMRSNLRLCTTSENQKNKNIGERNTSGYKGVVLHKRDKSFQAGLCSGGKYHYSCGYKTAIEAAEKYNEMALKYHGEFACLNKIDPQELAAAKSIKKQRKVRVYDLGVTGIRGVHNSGNKEYPFSAVKRVGDKIVRIGVYETAQEAEIKYKEFVKNLTQCSSVAS